MLTIKMKIIWFTDIQWNISHKKEWIRVSSNEVDEPRACYTEWSKSEREKRLLYIITYMESRKMVLMNPFAGQE